MSAVCIAFNLMYIIFKALIFLSVVVDYNNSIEVNDSTTSVSTFITKSSGEIVGDFKLIQRLDILGIKKDYFHEYYVYDDKYSLAPPELAEAAEQFERFGSITLLDAVKCSNDSNFIKNGSYYLKSNIFNGGHGEIWRAHRISPDGILDFNESFVLKRMHVKGKSNILRCALREIYFGELTRGNPKVTRYITYFNTEDDYWLVFRDEGVSLQNLLYAMTVRGRLALLEPSAIWKKLRTTKLGAESMKGLLHQLLSGLANLHAAGITHRDVKPSNILLNAEHEAKLLIADFSSAVNDEALKKGLYGSSGPTTDEESEEYMPPEVIFSDDVHFPYDGNYRYAYDSWSVGIVFLEMILGTARVFSVDQRTNALIVHRLRRADEKDVKNALLLAAMADYCIYHPTSESEEPSTSTSTSTSTDNYLMTEDLISHIQKKNHTKLSKSSATSAVTALLHPVATTSRCGLAELSLAIQRRDPLGKGYHDTWGLHLLSRLLAWNASDRITVREALDHAYFVGPYSSSLDGSEHPSLQRMRDHELGLVKESMDTDDDAESVSESASEYSATDDDLMLSMTIDPLSIPVNRLMTRSDFSRHHLPDETWQHSLPMECEDSLSSPHCHLTTSEVDDDEEGVLSQKSHPPPPSRHQHSLSSKSDPTIPVVSGISLVPDVTRSITFVCPHCGREFLGDWTSCDSHLKLRKHGLFCDYSAFTSMLPSCLSEHSLLPLDRQSGWCDLQGRRRHIEDAHAVVFAEHYKFWAVFDGHFGGRAARFASNHMQDYFDSILQSSSQRKEVAAAAESVQATLWSNMTKLLRNDSTLISLLPPSANMHVFDETSMGKGSNTMDSHFRNITAADAIYSLYSAFKQTNEKFLALHAATEKSGATATVAILFDTNYLLVGHVGDSRAVLCCDHEGKPLQLTTDHTPYDIQEAERVVLSGGTIEKYGVLRVNGQLAVTRSIGDKYLRNVLTEDPDVIILQLPPSSITTTTPPVKILDVVVDNNNNDTTTTPLPSLLTTSIELNACQKLRKLLDSSSENHKINNHNSQHRNVLSFLIVASDGLWDVMTNQQSVEFVCEKLHQKGLEIISDSTDERMRNWIFPEETMHDVARHLAQEAYVRGSMDNIGVCVISL